MATNHGITIEQFEEAYEAYIGFCTRCGAERECCEPDARRYKCDDCGSQAVYGAEELLQMGLVS